MRALIVLVILLAGCAESVPDATDGAKQAASVEENQDTPSGGPSASAGAATATARCTPEDFDVTWQRTSMGVIVLSSQQVEHEVVICQEETLDLSATWRAPSTTLQMRVLRGEDVVFHDQWDGPQPDVRDWSLDLEPGNHTLRFSLFGVDRLHDFGMAGSF